MIKAKHHPLYVWFFRHYSKFMIHHHFRKVFIEGATQTPTSSLIIVSNHFSWWDGFFINYLNHHLWQKKFHAMMLEEQLVKRKFLSLAGCFSIERSRAAATESLRYAQSILDCPENMLLMYPQGEIRSQMERPLHFKPGAEFIFRNSKATIKMVVVLTDYFSFKKPSVSFYIKDFDADHPNSKSLNETFNIFLKNCIEEQNRKARDLL
jgi:1-acyl-sn-glycerol-3-phosphate acyltransferase